MPTSGAVFAGYRIEGLSVRAAWARSTSPVTPGCPGTTPNVHVAWTPGHSVDDLYNYLLHLGHHLLVNLSDGSRRRTGVG